MRLKGTTIVSNGANELQVGFVGQYLPRYKLLINVDHLGLLRQEVFGWMWAADCDHRAREFEIEIHNRMNPEEYTKTLVHELWHD